jgi:hypothetical protein
MAKVNFLGLPADMSRVGSLESLAGIGWAKIPTYYYDVHQSHFPLTEAEFSGFTGILKIFDEETDTLGHQTNAATGSGVNEPFLAYGIGVVAIGEGLSFTSTGALVAEGVERATPCFDGCAVDGTPSTQATMWWGGAVWDFIENFFQAYRLQMVVNNRWLVLDESLFDVGMTPTPPEFVGASSSTVPAMPFIQETNQIMQDKNMGFQFVPQNSATSSICVPPPTSGVTYGHPRIIGLSNRLFCFNQPIPFIPGMRFDTKFVPVEGGGYFRDAMKRSSVFDSTKDSPSTLFSTPNECGTLGVVNIPGGKVSIGLVLKGVALHPRVVVDYVNSYLPTDSFLKLLAGNSYLFGLAQQMAASGVLKGNLAGIVDPKNALHE